jgi:hypothetical protein
MLAGWSMSEQQQLLDLLRQMHSQLAALPLPQGEGDSLARPQLPSAPPARLSPVPKRPHGRAEAPPASSARAFHHHRHARRHGAHQLVAHGAGGSGHLVDGQQAPWRAAPQRDLAAEPAPGTGVRSTASMSMLTRPTVRVRTPSTSTGVPVGQWRG